MKKLSIITINYNNKEGLLKTIESVINQTHKDFEYIIIDGGSTDGSVDVIEQYKKHIDVIVSEPDSGIYNAMNKGIRASSGDFLLFLNSGDWLYDNKTISLADSLIDGSVDIYYGNANFKSAKSDEIVKFAQKISFNFFFRNNLCHQATFIRKKKFDDIFYYNENFKIVSDWEFFVYAICIKNISHKHIDIIVSNYDFDGISSRDDYKELILRERQEVFVKYFPMFIEDYKMMGGLLDRRIVNILYIKKFKPAWKLLKGFSNILLFFLPKRK